MKRYRLVLPVCLAVALIAAAAKWVLPRAGHATPGNCVEAYYEACLAGDTTRYLSCLGEPLRTETRGRFAGASDLATALRHGTADLKNWVRQGDGAAEGADHILEVEEVRTPGVRRVRFRLRQVNGSWLIFSIETGPETPAAVPYGIHISKGS
jgi:hypothetical protein